MLFKDKSNIILRRWIIIGTITAAIIAVFIFAFVRGEFADEGTFYFIWLFGGLAFIFYRSWKYVFVPSSIKVTDSAVVITENPNPINNPDGLVYTFSWGQIQSIELIIFSDTEKLLTFSIKNDEGKPPIKLHTNFHNLEGQDELLKELERHLKQPVLQIQKDRKEWQQELYQEALDKVKNSKV